MTDFNQPDHPWFDDEPSTDRWYPDTEPAPPPVGCHGEFCGKDICFCGELPEPFPTEPAPTLRSARMPELKVPDPFKLPPGWDTAKLEAPRLPTILPPAPPSAWDLDLFDALMFAIVVAVGAWAVYQWFAWLTP